MGYVVRMPQMGMEMDRGEVVAWEADEGETVAADDLIAVVESEKATNDVEAREDGVLARIVVDEGGTVEPGTPIGIVAGPDEDLAEYEAEIDAVEAADADAAETEAAATDTGAGASPAASPSASASASAGAGAGSGPATGGDGGSAATGVRATPGARDLAGERGVDLAAVEGTGPQGVVTEDDVRSQVAESGADAAPDDGAGDGSDPGGDVRATPGARRLAGERGVDLAAVAGSGPQGVVTGDDVERAADAGTGAGATLTVREARALSGMQATVADRLGESYRNAVHVTVKRSFDAGTLRAVADAAAAAGLDASLADLLLAGVAARLDAQPAFNARFEDGEHRLIEEVNVGVAVDVDDGLVTPVLPEVADRSVEAVASARRDLVERVRAGEFGADDLSGGTFTVSNLGHFGVDSFDPVINPPEVAILGVGRVREDDRMTLSLSFDHRVVNGADAARFLDGLVGTLTDPLALSGFFEADVLDAPGVDVAVTVDPDGPDG